MDIIFEDTQQSNSTAVSAFIKLVQDHDPVAVFLSSYTPQNFAVEPEVTRAAVPSFYAGGADGLHQRGNPWMFRIKQPDSVIVDAMVDTVINRLGKRRPAILYIQNDYGQGLAKDAEGRFKAIGVDPILESYQASDNDLTPQLLSAVGQGADILLSVGFMGLGPVHTVTLAEARDKAREARKLILEGVDPIEAKRARKQARALEAASAMVFKDCAEKYIAAHKAGWRNAKHADQWTSTLETYAYPVFGSLPVASIDTALVTKVLEPIWKEKTETASRVRGRIEAIKDTP